MQDQYQDTDNFSVVGLLREKTEELDMKQYLKSTLGGYTKSSVLNYLAALKKQQQESSETFNRNLKAVLEEKEKLKNSTQVLKDKLLKAENEYKNLYESLSLPDLEKSEAADGDLTVLKKNLAARENELIRISDLNIGLQNEIDSLKRTVSELNEEAERSRQQSKTQKDLLAIEKADGKTLRDQIIDLTKRLDRGQDEIRFLKSAVSQANITELQGIIAALTAQAAAQAEILANANAESALKEHANGQLAAENAAAKEDIKRLSEVISSQNLRNEKLSSANQALKGQLEAEYKNKISLIEEKTGLLIEKISANKKLDEKSAAMSVLEFELEQCKKQGRQIP